MRQRWSGATGSPVRAVVVDDQTLFRIGLVRLLTNDGRVEVVGEAANATEALSLIDHLAPEIVISDLRMPGMDGVEFTRQVLAHHPETRVLILSAFEDLEATLDAMCVGASGYVLKDASPDAIVDGIGAVLARTRVLTRSVAERMLVRAWPDEGTVLFDGLSGRQLEILRMVAMGLANKQIAARLGVTVKTVRNQVSIIHSRLRLTDRSQATLYAARHGLIEV